MPLKSHPCTVFTITTDIAFPAPTTFCVNLPQTSLLNAIFHAHDITTEGEEKEFGLVAEKGEVGMGRINVMSIVQRNHIT